MWWEAPKSMIQVSWDMETDVDKADANVSEAEAANDEVGVAEEVLRWETNRWSALISSLDRWPLDSEAGGVVVGSEVMEATECALGRLLPNLLPPLPRCGCRGGRSNGCPCKSQHWPLVCLDRPQCSHLWWSRSSKEIPKWPPWPHEEEPPQLARLEETNANFSIIDDRFITPCRPLLCKHVHTPHLTMGGSYSGFGLRFTHIQDLNQLGIRTLVSPQHVSCRLKYPLYRQGRKRYNDLIPPTASLKKHSRWLGVDPLVWAVQSFVIDYTPLLHVQFVNKLKIGIPRSDELCLRRDSGHLFLVS